MSDKVQPETSLTDQDVATMAALIRQLSVALRMANPKSEWPQKAFDYLKRKGLQGSILRDTP